MHIILQIQHSKINYLVLANNKLFIGGYIQRDECTFFYHEKRDKRDKRAEI